MINRTPVILPLGFCARLIYKIKVFFAGIFLPILQSGKRLKLASGKDKTAVVLSYPFMGLGLIILGSVEKGLLNLIAAALYILFMYNAGLGLLFGYGSLTTDDGSVWQWSLIFTVIISAVMLIFWLKSIAYTVNYIGRKVGGDFDFSVTAKAAKKIAASVKNYVSDISNVYSFGKKSDKIAMSAAFLLPGAGIIIQRQTVKGILYIAVTALFAVYMAVRGFADLAGLITLRVPTVRSDYSIVFGVFAIAIAAIYLIFHISSMRAVALNATDAYNGKKLSTFKQDFSALRGKKLYKPLLFLPIAGIIVFTVLPLVFMILLAFTDYAYQIGTVPSVVRQTYLSWTGFASFIKLFTMGEYFRALTNVVSWTFIWAFLATFSCYFGGMFLAVLINKKQIKVKALFRSLFVLTIAIPQLVTLRVMYSMFHDYGPINAFLLNMGWITTRISFWGNVHTAKILIILINMWVGVPYFLLLITGLLMNIPKDIYEYAVIDGANKWQQFRFITLPYLLFMTGPLLITNFVSNINNFNVIWLLTGGGPDGIGTGGVAGGTDILITWLYKLTMLDVPKYNIGSAIGIIMFVISAGISLVVYRRSSSYTREDDFS